MTMISGHPGRVPPAAGGGVPDARVPRDRRHPAPVLQEHHAPQQGTDRVGAALRHRHALPGQGRQAGAQRRPGLPPAARVPQPAPGRPRHRRRVRPNSTSLFGCFKSTLCLYNLHSAVSFRQCDTLKEGRS